MYVRGQSAGANAAGDPLRLGLRNGKCDFHKVCFELHSLQSVQTISLHRFFFLWFPNLFDLYTSQPSMGITGMPTHAQIPLCAMRCVVYYFIHLIVFNAGHNLLNCFITHQWFANHSFQLPSSQWAEYSQLAFILISSPFQAFPEFSGLEAWELHFLNYLASRGPVSFLQYDAFVRSGGRGRWKVLFLL